PMPDVDVVIIDEVHQWFDVYAKWIAEAWAGKPVIGLSATPWRRGLGKFFGGLVIAATTAELIEAGHLSPFRVFAPSHPDLSKVRTVAGDYQTDDLGAVMSDKRLVADSVETYRLRGEG